MDDSTAFDLELNALIERWLAVKMTEGEIIEDMTAEIARLNEILAARSLST